MAVGEKRGPGRDQGTHNKLSVAHLRTAALLVNLNPGKEIEVILVDKKKFEVKCVIVK